MTVSSLRQRFHQSVAQLEARYLACSPRERLALAGLAFSLGATLLFLLVDGLHGERRRVEHAVPEALARTERMRQQAAQLAELQAAPVTVDLPKIEILRTAASAKGLRLDIQPLGDGFALQGHAPPDRLFPWLAELQQEWRLRPQRLDLARDASGLRIDITLIPPANE